ncbi:MAG: N-acetylmuramoyl-L-alanine amidase [Rickettsiales bacterium]|nr:N-acetylmuramoyl-L-alanine amidase [Rickettsiales bacterium]
MKRFLLLIFTLLVSIAISFIFINNCFSNEVVAIKTYDRENYIRIMFETTEKPKYFVNQYKNKINVNLPNTTIKSNLHKNIFKLNTIEDIELINEVSGITFIVSVKNNASLMRYLYTEPSKVSTYYRVIVDIYKDDKTIDDIIVGMYDDKTKSIDDVIDNVKWDNETIDDIIDNSVKAKDINELLALNNIIDEKEITRSFEEQNNEQVDLDSFLKSISVDFSDKLIKKEKRTNRNVTKYNQFVVVLDAGHGGKDPGAIGVKKTKEKDINLLYARAIKNELGKNSKIKVIMTRNSDIFIELKDRVNKARMLNADLFISIHSDSSTNRRASGLSVYTLMKSASDTRTTKLMVTDSKYKIINNMNYWKNKIKYDSIRYKTLAESTKFTNVLINNLKSKNVKMFGEPHKYGNFAVLLAPEFPSVLIELSFLSNPQDEKLLKNQNYRNTISKSVATSVFKYFKI